MKNSEIKAKASRESFGKKNALIGMAMAAMAVINPVSAATQEDVDAVIECALTAKSGTKLNMHRSPSNTISIGRVRTEDEKRIRFGVITTNKGDSVLSVSDDKETEFIDGGHHGNPDGIPDSMINSKTWLKSDKVREDAAHDAQSQFDKMIADVKEACESNLPRLKNKK